MLVLQPPPQAPSSVGLLQNDYLAAGVVVLLGVLAITLLQRYPRFEGLRPHSRLVIRRIASLVVLAVTLIGTLGVFGVPVSVLLGTAGVLTVAFGFASQTSMSNVISGFFLMGERPFVIGDLVEVAGTTGFVETVDLLSVRLRTYQNLLVRIPNEEMLKSTLTNLTHYPIRRFDLQVGVAYKEDLPHVTDVLLEVADRNPVCLEEPTPRIIFQGFGDSSVNLQLSAWSVQGEYFRLRSSLPGEVKAELDRRGIEIPFPHRTVYAGAATEPIPVRVVPPDGPSRPGEAGGADRPEA